MRPAPVSSTKFFIQVAETEKLDTSFAQGRNWQCLFTEDGKCLKELRDDFANGLLKCVFFLTSGIDLLREKSCLCRQVGVVSYALTPGKVKLKFESKVKKDVVDLNSLAKVLEKLHLDDRNVEKSVYADEEAIPRGAYPANVYVCVFSYSNLFVFRLMFRVVIQTLEG